MQHRRRQPGTRGIYLITTLLLMMFLVMICGAVLVSFQVGLSSSTGYNRRQLALDAALCGLHYVQARLETSPLNYSPYATALSSATTVVSNDGSFTVQEESYSSGGEQAWNIFGILNNTNVIGPNEQKITLVFRVSFNGSYQSTPVTDPDWTFATAAGAPLQLLNGTQNPAISYISMNNLNQPVATQAYTFNGTGNLYHTIPGQTADVIVEGIQLGSNGTIVSRRVVESLLSPSSTNLAFGPMGVAGDLDMTLYQADGTVSVSYANTADPKGISSLGNINLYAPDPTSSPIPYSSSAGPADLPNLSSHSFMYYQTTATPTPSANYTNSLAQAKTVNPPSVSAAQIPISPSATQLNAGTYAVYNGQVLYFPVDYDNTQTLNNQAWGWDSSTNKLTFQGVDYASVMASNSNISFNATTNTLSIQNNDVNVQAGAAQGFAFVVAPYVGDVPNPASTGGTDSNAIGSAQLAFPTPSPGADMPQVRSPGTMTIVGNVSGQGSMVTTGTTSSPGDINIVGNSSVDPRQNGVVMYAANDVNVQQLDAAQPPSNGSLNLSTSATNPVSSAMSTNGLTPGSNNGIAASTGTTTVTLSSSFPSNVSIGDSSGSPPTTITLTPGVPTVITNPSPEIHITDSSADGATISVTGPMDNIHIEANITDLTINTSGSVSGADPAVHTEANSSLTLNYTGSSSQTVSYRSEAGSTLNMNSNSNLLTASQDGGPQTANVGPLPTGVTAAPSGGGALDMQFNGLMYAAQKANITNQCGNVQIDGALVTYGNTPGAGTSPGTTGTAQIAGNGISLIYDPSMLGPFVGLLGGQMKLRQLFVTVF